jgi:hypothetical protein
MLRPWIPSRLSADMLALQSHAERAGYALACSFGSSAEFEAAVIKSRLDAGVYGPKRRRRSIAYAGVAIVTLIVLALIFCFDSARRARPRHCAPALVGS